MGGNETPDSLLSPRNLSDLVKQDGRLGIKVTQFSPCKSARMYNSHNFFLANSPLCLFCDFEKIDHNCAI